MENFRFILEPYNRHQRNRYTCPSCGKHREFTRYIDTQGAISFPEYVGKCNRINNCGYHYTPAMYFDEHPECKYYVQSHKWYVEAIRRWMYLFLLPFNQGYGTYR